DSAGVFVQVWPIGVAELPRWLSERFRRAGLNADREAIDALIDRIEGNLLAAIQEIERLRLVSDSDRIGLAQIVEGVADSSRYDVFSLIDAAVGQDYSRTLKIIQGLKLEGAEPLFVVNMLARELRSLVGMAVAIEKGSPADKAIAAARVWPKRKTLVARCLRAHQSKTLLGLQRDVGRIDRLIKGIGKGEPWTELTDLVLALAGRPVFQVSRAHSQNVS
ncbi:MAG: DNA polymerase III subunit delta, partial [Pseudomonadales bacterium]